MFTQRQTNFRPVENSCNKVLYKLDNPNLKNNYTLNHSKTNSKYDSSVDSLTGGL